MADVQPLPPPKVGESPFPSLTRGVAALSILSLGSALLFNVILFLFLDTTLITAFTISDHLATAVEMLPFVLVVTLVVFARFSLKAATPKEARLWLFALPAATMVLWIVASRFGWFFEGGLFFGMSLVYAWAIGGDFLLIRAMANASKVTQLGSRLFAMMIFVIMGYAVMVGAGLQSSQISHVVTLKNDATVEGKLVQILERGLVVVTLPDRGVLFIHKDEYKLIRRHTTKDR